MLETIIVILIILWLLGYFALNVGNLIHILLVIAVIVILIRVIQGRRPICIGGRADGGAAGVRLPRAESDQGLVGGRA